MPQIRLEYGEDWQSRFEREVNKPRRFGLLAGLAIGVILTLLAILVVFPWFQSLDWSTMWQFGT